MWCHLEVYNTGDKVYFKRDDTNRWPGHGTVIGQDRQVVFVRHGGVFVRVPTCRLKKVHASPVDDDTEKTNPILPHATPNHPNTSQEEEEETRKAHSLVFPNGDTPQQTQGFRKSLTLQQILEHNACNPGEFMVDLADLVDTADLIDLTDIRIHV